MRPEMFGYMNAGAPPGTLRHCDALAKLVLRKQRELDSDKCGSIMPGSPIIILEQVTEEDGSVRVHVGKDSTPRGLAICPLGWATAYKDGYWIVTPPEGGETRPDGWSRADSGTGESMASRIAKRRQRRASLRQDASSGEIGAGYDDEGDDAGVAAAHTEPAVAVKLKEFRSSVQLREMVAEEEARAQAEEAVRFGTIESQLGQLLTKKNVNPTLLMAEWDRNRDGDISKTEFRVNVRQLGLTEAEASGQQIDALYDSLDNDKSGSIDTEEMKRALARLKDSMRDVSRKEASKRAHAAEIRAVGALYEAAAVETVAYETEEVRLSNFRRGTIATRLGQHMKSRVVKVGQVVTEWDKDGSGSLDPIEARSSSSLSCFTLPHGPPQPHASPSLPASRALASAVPCQREGAPGFQGDGRGAG
jgi:hypothetical protein